MIRLQNIDADIRPSRTFGRGKYLIGRSPACDLEIPDKTMSRQHAMLEVVDDARIYLTDLKSRNGTLVNGERINTTIRLKPRDVVTFGDIRFSVAPVDDTALRGDTKPVRDKSLDGSGVTLEFGADTGDIPITSARGTLITALAALGQILVDPREPERVEQEIILGIRMAIQCDVVAVLLLGQKRSEFSATITDAESRTSGIEPVSCAGELIESAIEGAGLVRSCVSTDKDADRAAVVCRLDYAGRTLGVLYLDRETSDDESSDSIFEDVEDRAVKSVADMVASKLANLQLLQSRPS